MSNVTINWSKLLNRTPPNVNDVGIFWTEEEAKAVLELKIPADYVRMGCTTQEAYEKMKVKNETYQKENGELPLMFWTKDALYLEAARLNIQYTAQTPKSTLVLAITNARTIEAEHEGELDGLSKKELQILCEEKGIEYEATDKKDELIEKLKAVIV